jgi:hypothetical protein
VSLDFFDAFRETRDSVSAAWPAYIEQTTDFSGCTRFGSLELVRCYRLLTRFRTLHPQRYRDRIEDLLSPIEEEFTDGKCACGGVEDMEKEFRAFLREFPKSSIAPRVRERLHDLEAGTPKMKDHCLSD